MGYRAACTLLHMSIVSISFVRNEADIIAAFVRHSASIVDHMVIVDNGSTDATPDILHTLTSTGYPLDVRHDHAPYHAQSSCLTALLHEIAAESSVDWILPLDADEFLAARHGKDVREVIAALPEDRVSLLPWRTYVPLSSDDHAEENPKLRIRHRRSREEPQYEKVLIPRRLAKPDTMLAAGNHRLRTRDGSEPPHTLAENLLLCHFPVRSVAQVLRKVCDGAERLAANPDREAMEGFHWTAMANSFTHAPPQSVTDLTALALQYGSPGPLPPDIFPTLDPLPCQ